MKGGLSEISAGYPIVLCLIEWLLSEQKFTKPSGTLAQKQRYFPQMVTPVRDRPDRSSGISQTQLGLNSRIDAAFKNRY
jgi:hypothetical protein